VTAALSKKKGVGYAIVSSCRPLIPIMFEEELRGYDIWGWQDPDTLLGNLEDAYAYHKIEGFDAVGTGNAGFTNGHLSYFQNDERLRRLARSSSVLAEVNHRLTNHLIGNDDEYHQHVARAGLRFLTYNTVGALVITNKEWPNEKLNETWEGKGFDPHVSWIYDRGSILQCPAPAPPRSGSGKHKADRGRLPRLTLLTHVHFGGGPLAYMRAGKRRLVRDSIMSRWSNCLQQDDCTACFPEGAWVIA